MDSRTNYYGSLCSELYDILHPEAPRDELEFYLSYAEKGHSILEALCGSGRSLIPFAERGLSIKGMDNSREMLEKLRRKAGNADVLEMDAVHCRLDERFDYVFISSGSVSLFTDRDTCATLLKNMRSLLREGGRLVFAVDTTAARLPDDADYVLSVSATTERNHTLLLKTKNHYDEKTRTQFSPGIYELYDGQRLLRREFMDFQTHLYEPGEMEALLREVGFNAVAVYSSFAKTPAVDNSSDMFLYECSR